MAHFVLKMLPGVERPAIVSLIPSRGGHTYMLDLGANAAVHARSSCASSRSWDRCWPRISTGAHAAAAGGPARTSARRRSRATRSCRPRTICSPRAASTTWASSRATIFSRDKVDVVVTDGFTGNVALKTMEGAARLIADALREEFTRSLPRKLGALAARPRSSALRTRLDPRRYNGATMVGIERHRDQESRRHRYVRFSTRHRGGRAGGAQRRAGAHCGTAWAQHQGIEGSSCTHASPAPAAICRKKY